MKIDEPLFPICELNYNVEHNGRYHGVCVPPSHLFYNLFLAIADIHKPNGEALTQRTASEKLEIFYRLTDELIESLKKKPYLINTEEQLFRLAALKNNISRGIIFLDDVELKNKEHLPFYRKIVELAQAIEQNTKLKTKKNLFTTIMFDWRCGLNESLGSYYLDHDQFIIAEGYFTDSLEDLSNVSGQVDPVMQFSKWYNFVSLAAVSFARGRYDDAEYIYKKAFGLYQDNIPLVDKPLHRLNILYDLAQLHEKRQNLEYALSLYRLALEVNNRFLKNTFVKMQKQFTHSILTQVVAIRKKIVAIESELKTIKGPEKKLDIAKKQEKPRKVTSQPVHIMQPNSESVTQEYDNYSGPFEVERAIALSKKHFVAGRPKTGPKVKMSPVSTLEQTEIPMMPVRENRFAHLKHLMTRVSNPHNEKAVYLAYLNVVFVCENLSKIHGAYDCVVKIFNTCKFVGKHGQGIKYVKADPKVDGTEYTLKIKPSGKYGDSFRIFGQMLKDSNTPRMEVAEIMFDGVDLDPHGPGKIITP